MVMKKTEMPPDDVLACVWFANPHKLDWEDNKEQIITSILNRGTMEAVRWAFQRYGEAAIRNVVSHPKRGQWFPKTIHFWIHFFNLSLDPKVYQKALFRLGP
jgi:hypothetical protein